MTISCCFRNSPLVSFWSGLAGAPCRGESRLKAYRKIFCNDRVDILTGIPDARARLVSPGAVLKRNWRPRDGAA